MLKEVGASGQISLGKKYAGQLFDLQVQADGCILMQPVKVVPVNPSVQEERADYAATPGTTSSGARQWAQDHAQDIAQYNAWAEQREPYSRRVRRWRAESQK
jgi:hypothetical protein